MRPLSKTRKWMTLLAMVLGLFMPMLDNLVVNVALPSIQRNLGAKLSDLQWIVDAYTLPFAAFMLTAGSLADLYGRKRFFLTGLVLFGIASLGCATAEGTEALIAFRSLQGLGAAFLLPGSLAILTATFQARQLGAAIGIWAATSALAVAVGPLVGGYLVEHHSWESIFFINLPVGALAILLTALVVRESRVRRAARIDLSGLFTGTAGLFFLVFALIEGGNRGWTSEVILSCFGLSALFMIVFIVIESKRFSPMLPVSLFRNRSFAGANFVAAAVFFALFGITFLLALYLQNVRGYSPFETGQRLFPLTLAILVISPVAGRLSDRLGSRGLMTVGCALAAGGLALLLRTEPSSAYTTLILPALVVLGTGIALTMTPMTVAVMSSVDPERAGAAPAVTNTTRELGGVLGVALIGAVFAASFKDRLLVTGFTGETARTIVDNASSNAAAGGGSLAAARLQAPSGASDEVIQGVLTTAQEAFVGALHSGLVIAIAVMVLASLVAVIFVGTRVRAVVREAAHPAPRELPPAPATALPEAAVTLVPEMGTRTAPEVANAPPSNPGHSDTAPSVLDELREVLYELPFTAGSRTVEENLAEVARATLSYYHYGLAHDSSDPPLPIGATDDAGASAERDVASVAGYLDLERRLGRIKPETSPDLAASLLMAALAAHALSHEILGDGDRERDMDFATGMTRVLVEGIGIPTGRLHSAGKQVP